MLAYAASRPAVVDRRPHPNFMLAIIGAHVALVALVMSAKMEIQRHKPEPPIVVDTITEPTPPPPNPITRRQPTPQPPITTVHEPVTPLPPVDHSLPLAPDSTIDPGPIAGAGALVTHDIPQPIVTPVKTGPRLITAQSELKPPYPASKLLNEEEAVLTLKLTIDGQGRVISVDTVGRADPVFLEAARRHLLAHWRYKPASEDGRPVASTTVVTLHFELDG